MTIRNYVIFDTATGIIGQTGTTREHNLAAQIVHPEETIAIIEGPRPDHMQLRVAIEQPPTQAALADGCAYNAAPMLGPSDFRTRWATPA